MITDMKRAIFGLLINLLILIHQPSSLPVKVITAPNYIKITGERMVNRLIDNEGNFSLGISLCTCRFSGGVIFNLLKNLLNTNPARIIAGMQGISP